MKLQTRKKGQICFFLSVLLCLFLCQSPGFAKDKTDVRFFQSGEYWVFCSLGVKREMPKIGPGMYQEISYKLVFQGEWQETDKLRLMEIRFMETGDFYAARDVVSGKSFNAQGEYYGSAWVPESRAGKIRSVLVLEVSGPGFDRGRKKKAPAPPPAEIESPADEEVPPPPAPPETSAPEPPPAPQGLFGKAVITNEEIKKTLAAYSMDSPANSNEKNSPEDGDEDEEDEESA